MKNHLFYAILVLFCSMSSHIISHAQESTLSINENSDSVYLLLTSHGTKKIQKGFRRLSKKSSKDREQIMFTYVDKERKLYRTLYHCELLESEIKHGQYNPDKHDMQFKTVPTSFFQNLAPELVYDLDNKHTPYYIKGTKTSWNTDKATLGKFFSQLFGKKVWVIDKSDMRQSTDSIYMVQTKVIPSY